MSLLELDDVHVHFGGVRALDGVSLRVERGDLLGIIGPNGSGKSTLIGVITRLTEPTSGAMRFEGQDYTTAPPHMANRLGIARTFQTVRLIPQLTVLQNVLIGAAAQAVTRGPLRNWARWGARGEDRRLRERAEHALERVEMVDFISDRPTDLPYGLQRKVEIARALASEPTLLLLDEPTAGMSQNERREIGDLLLQLRSDGLTQVLVEHDLGLKHRVCNAAVALDFGHVIAVGTPREVVDHPRVREAYLGKQADELGEVGR
jgi:ABC-type branched-subunit amino acid transport system ATPase component